MIVKWLHHQSHSTQVIVFFSGWGFDEDVVAHLNVQSDTDVLFVCDYTNLDHALPDLSGYKKRSLIAWSFGVGNYLVWQQKNRVIGFDRKIAINGTPIAVDYKLGIAGKVVQHTIDRLDPETLQEFRKRCGISTTASFALDDAQIKAIKAELEFIKQRDYSSKTDIVWNKAWISQGDKIFSTANQQRAWKNTPQMSIDAPHSPFDSWSDWQEILA